MTAGFSEILFAHTSCFAKQWPGFARSGVRILRFYNLTTALTMMVVRSGLAIPALAFADLLTREALPTSVGNSSD